jgi:hypothetical protein
VAVAKDVEEALRIVTKEPGITVKPVRPLVREVSRRKTPEGDMICQMEGVLCDLRG